jgi:hypothetical protein
VEKEVGHEGAMTSKVVHGERNEGNVLGVEGRDNFFAPRGVRCSSLEF